ncbi:MAG: hypothetical protein EBV65_00280, partial [Gammaproteobacteria bacterium]|nr:hypothetical protein [Gammaproteobacteria bacterium]
MTPSNPSAAAIADVQSHRDERRIPISKVGIKDILHPVRLRDRSTGEQHTVASFNMFVDLPHHFKGTHMSRFVKPLDTALLEQVAARHSALVTVEENAVMGGAGAAVAEA